MVVIFVFILGWLIDLHYFLQVYISLIVSHMEESLTWVPPITVSLFPHKKVGFKQIFWWFLSFYNFYLFSMCSLGKYMILYEKHKHLFWNTCTFFQTKISVKIYEDFSSYTNIFLQFIIISFEVPGHYFDICLSFHVQHFFLKHIDNYYDILNIYL